MSDMAITVAGLAVSLIASAVTWYLGDDEIDRQRHERAVIRRKQGVR